MKISNFGLLTSLAWVGFGGLSASAVSIACAFTQLPSSGEEQIFNFETTDERVQVNDEGKLCAEYVIEILHPDQEYIWEVSAEGATAEDVTLLGDIASTITTIDEGHVKLTLTLTEKQTLLMKNAGGITVSIKANDKKIETPTLTMRGSLETDNWDAIATAADSGLNSLKQYCGMGADESFVGMTKTLTIDGITYGTRVIGENEDNIHNASKTAALTIQFTDSIGSTAFGTNRNDFIGSNVNKFLNDSSTGFANKLKNVIPTVKTVDKYVYTNPSGTITKQTYTPVLFPLAISEITNRFQEATPGFYQATPLSYSYLDGWKNDEYSVEQYTYFKNIEAIDDSSGTKIRNVLKVYDYGTGNALSHWIRSENWKTEAKVVAYITASGNVSAKSSPDGDPPDIYGIAPCFCI